MPSQQVTIELPELRWSVDPDGSMKFEAGTTPDRSFVARIAAGSNVMTATYRHDEDNGSGDYWLQSRQDLIATLGDLLVYCTGLHDNARLGRLAESCVRDGQGSLPDLPKLDFDPKREAW